MNIGHKFLAVTDVTVKPETQKLREKKNLIFLGLTGVRIHREKETSLATRTGG